MKSLKTIILALMFLSTKIFADITIAYAKTPKLDSKKVESKQDKEVKKIQKIADKNNIKVVFKGVPWKRALLMLEKGVVDGVINASYKINRAKYANYPMKDNKPDSSKRLNDGNSYYIYKHIDSKIKWDGKKFVNGGDVAIMAKYAVIEDLKKHKNIKIKEFTSNSLILRKLASKQIDAYAGTAVSADEILKKFPTLAKNIVRESLPIRKKDYFLIFSKKTYPKKSKEMEKIWTELQNINNQK